MTEKKCTCLICKKTFDGDFHYCPNCGAKMPSIKDEEKNAIDAAINELFIDENEDKAKDDLKILPIHEPKKVVVKEVETEKKQLEPSKILNFAGIGLGILVVALIVYFGIQIFTKPNQPKPVNPSPVNPEVSQPVEIEKPEQEEEPKEDETLKNGVDVEFESVLEDMESILKMEKINVQEKDENALTLTYFYTTSEALTITFADSANSFNPIGIDVPLGSSSVYFDLSKSLLSKDNDFIVTIRKTGDSEMKPAIITITKETMGKLLEKMS